MALPLQKFREVVFQILYSQAFNASHGEDTALMLMNELKITKKAALQANEKVVAVEARLPAIDATIAQASQNYSFTRISSVEKTILRLALFEMLFPVQIPPRIVIAEAIRLTRKFGTPESAHFVNAILDHVYKNALSNESMSL